MNHSFDAAVSSNFTCRLGNNREPLKTMQETIIKEKARGSHLLKNS
jgi:hypothetical protein